MRVGDEEGAPTAAGGPVGAGLLDGHRPDVQAAVPRALGGEDQAPVGHHQQGRDQPQRPQPQAHAGRRAGLGAGAAGVGQLAAGVGQQREDDEPDQQHHLAAAGAGEERPRPAEQRHGEHDALLGLRARAREQPQGHQRGEHQVAGLGVQVHEGAHEAAQRGAMRRVEVAQDAIGAAEPVDHAEECDQAAGERDGAQQPGPTAPAHVHGGQHHRQEAGLVDDRQPGGRRIQRDGVAPPLEQADVGEHELPHLEGGRRQGLEHPRGQRHELQEAQDDQGRQRPDRPGQPEAPLEATVGQQAEAHQRHRRERHQHHRAGAAHRQGGRRDHPDAQPAAQRAHPAARRHPPRPSRSLVVRLAQGPSAPSTPSPEAVSRSRRR